MLYDVSGPFARLHNFPPKKEVERPVFLVPSFAIAFGYHRSLSKHQLQPRQCTLLHLRKGTAGTTKAPQRRRPYKCRKWRDLARVFWAAHPYRVQHGKEKG